MWLSLISFSNRPRIFSFEGNFVTMYYMRKIRYTTTERIGVRSPLSPIHTLFLSHTPHALCFYRSLTVQGCSRAHRRKRLRFERDIGMRRYSSVANYHPERKIIMQPQIQEYVWVVKRKWAPKTMKELKRRKRRQLERVY